tara:strand:+ start:44 stop:271 length:228 start_codon:yes stop_codon:yes gene_type:complete
MYKLSEKIKCEVFDDWSVSVYKTLHESAVKPTRFLSYDVVVNHFDIDDVDEETFENKNKALERFDDIIFEGLQQE